MNQSNFIQFWGKAQPISDNRQTSHPLAWHSLDIAACAEILNEIFPQLALALARLGGTNIIITKKLLVALAALHDIGKFSIGFQVKSPDHCPSILKHSSIPLPAGDHCAIGFRLLTIELADCVEALMPSVDCFARTVIARAVTAHHGRPVEASSQTLDEIGSYAVVAARDFALALTQLISGDPYRGVITDDQIMPLSWQIAGFVNLADWLGSNQAIFRYEGPHHALEDYWHGIARPRARLALEQAGLRAIRLSPQTGLRALTQSDRVPSPLQNYAEAVPLPPSGPCCFLLEDMTGAGKTEAAAILAHRLMLSGRGDGLFIALPTMATANAMYQRLSGLHRRLFDPEAIPSLALAHGAAHLHDGFQNSILDVGRQEAAYDGGTADDDITASAACAAWIANDRRRAFFADVGAGTIDQAFLAVLPVKFAPLRLLGLSRRILIIDEAHAYAPYENEELATLITFQGAAGGSVIVLSATLPESVKDRLVKAWRSGLGMGSKTVAWPSAYPLATLLDGAVTCQPIEPRSDLLSRRVEVERLADAEAALAAIEDAARGGASVAWVRNTVDEAIAAQAALAARGVPARLFHARFAMCDRQKIEADVLTTFGPNGTAEQRRGQVLIATQVVEQSLDLDFDLLISDLAPIDLLIQRAGRLWRHGRADRPVSVMRLLIVAPDPTDGAEADWLRDTLPGTSHVYRNHALMWQTAKILFAAGAIESPSGVRPLVEAVYGRDALAGAPATLDRNRLEAEGRESADRTHAKLNLLRLREGYGRASGQWSSDVHMPTRLGEPRVVFRLALWDGVGLRPWAGPIDDALSPLEAERLWARSEVALTQRRASRRGAYPLEIERAAAKLEAPWRERGFGPQLLPLLAEGEHYRAMLAKGALSETKRVDPTKNSFRVVYDARCGVVFSDD